MKPKNKEMIQGVIITFDDGTTASFSGPAVCFKGEKKKISDISFTEPKPLPEDCSWSITEGDSLSNVKKQNGRPMPKGPPPPLKAKK
jgi:hypothetical protein